MCLMNARRLVHLLMVWRWTPRLICHQSLWCCQFIDNPNCNQGGGCR